MICSCLHLNLPEAVQYLYFLTALGSIEPPVVQQRGDTDLMAIKDGNRLMLNGLTEKELWGKRGIAVLKSSRCMSEECFLSLLKVTLTMKKE